MKAVVLKGPFRIDVEERPHPVILQPTDAIVKVSRAGVCGSDLHAYRGHQKTATGYVMGHEFTGVVEEIGAEVKNIWIGQKVVATFAPVCMKCWFCEHGFTNRCQNGGGFGNPLLPGGQAEYVRAPYADGTLLAVPDDLDEELLIMMCDILPTGYYGASRAISGYLQVYQSATSVSSQSTPLAFKAPSLEEAVFVCIGCGPVGLCAIMTARYKGVKNIYVVDSVDERLEQAARWGGIPLKLGKDDVSAAILAATGGRGADAVIEVVGNRAALRSAFDLLRPCGVLSSIGFHQGDLPFTAFECYTKNLNINLGRAPARAVYDEALEVLIAHKTQLSDFISHRMPMSEAPHAYEIFEKQQARKVVLLPQ
ncbi:GroES-like protein [Cadophora sp. DSE1049]|nr:GroES-like protein [Cadophora sp. DSE1049]